MFTRTSPSYRLFDDGQVPTQLNAVHASIFTERLELVPMTPAFLQASLAGDTLRAAEMLSIVLPDEWPDVSRVLQMRLSQLEADPSLQPWLLRAICLRHSREMIGRIGFHTAPNPEYLQKWSPGAVEFGYAVFAAHQRCGYAREAAQALMRWAHDEHRVSRFMVSIRPDNFASQQLAAGLGFIRIGSEMDEIDGEEDVLELKYSPSKNPS